MWYSRRSREAPCQGSYRNRDSRSHGILPFNRSEDMTFPPIVNRFRGSRVARIIDS